MDKYFTVKVISQTPNPQQIIYAALHQDYSEGFVWDEFYSEGLNFWHGPSEERCGDIAVDRLLKGGRGHYGPFEHPQIVLNCGWFPHSTMQQLRTHRHASFDVQSGRYTGKRIAALGKRIFDIGLSVFSSAEEKLFSYDHDDSLKDYVESVFYLRPPGFYTNRQGKKYEYTDCLRRRHLVKIAQAAVDYFDDIENGLSEEHARGMIPFDVRQHWVVSCNMRSLIHLLSMRGKPDAQLECQQLCELILPHFKAWAPQIYDYFEKHEWKKGRLAA